MPGHDIVVVGASAGGVEPLTRLAAALPKDLAATVLVVLHVPAEGTSALPRILERNGALPARHAQDGDALEPGRIYVAPPDQHLLVGRDLRVWLSRGPRENGHRPAIDPLFRSAAVAYGPRVVGVVLSGSLDDGAAGLHAVKRRGGLALVQDPDEALHPSMPLAAMATVDVDRVASVDALAAEIDRLARTDAPEEVTDVPDEIEREAEAAKLSAAEMNAAADAGEPSVFTCPECHGVLWELEEGELLRFRCRVGHAFSVDTLLAEQSADLENVLWVALRALDERAHLGRRLALRARERGHEHSARHFDGQAAEAARATAALRRMLASRAALAGQVGEGEIAADFRES